MTSDVAVILPLHNGERWIGETLTAVFEQAVPPDEVIVVDDYSEDRSVALAERFPVVLIRNSGRGATAARRTGIERSRASLVAYLDQDDIWHPDHLRVLRDLLRQHPNCPAALSGVQPFAGCIPQLAGVRPGIERLDPWQAFPFDSVGVPSAVLMRRSELNTMHELELYPYTGDGYLWLRATLRAPLIATASITCGQRLHDDSASLRARARSPVDYLAEKRRACVDALAHLERVRPDEVPDLRRRLSALDTATGVVAAVHSASDLRAPCLALEDALESRDDAFVLLACRLVIWFLEPGWRGEGTGDHLATLVRRWPFDARRTRAAVRDIVATAVPFGALRSVVLTNVTDWDCWILLTRTFFERARTRIRRRRHRLHESPSEAPRLDAWSEHRRTNL